MNSLTRNGKGPKVLFLAGSLTGHGGVENIMGQWVRVLNNHGIDTRIVVFDPIKSGAFQETYDVLVIRKADLPPVLKLFQGPHAFLTILRVLLDFRPSLIIGLNPYPILLAHLCNFILGHKAAVASWVHNPIDQFPRWRWLRFADVHIAIGSGLYRDYVSRFPKERVMTLPNFVTFGSDTEQQRKSRDGQPPNITFIGRLTKQKRVDVILHALAIVESPWSLTVIGDGPELPALRTTARELGIEGRVVWYGWQTDPWPLVAGDIVVLSSDYEGLPLVILEAMARGFAVISTDCEFGPSDIVQDGVNGWLFPVGDFGALARLLDDIASNRKRIPDPDVVRKSVEHHNQERVVSQLLELVYASGPFREGHDVLIH